MRSAAAAARRAVRTAEGLPGRLAERVPPMVAVGVAVLVMSTSAILVRASEAPSAVKALYRVAFTALLLAPVGVRRRAALRALAPRHALAAAVTGLALAAHFLAWFESLAWTSVAAAATLVQTQLVFVVAGGALLLGERLTRGMLAGIAVALVGTVAMSLGDLLGGAVVVGPDPLYGNALAVGGAVMAAAYVLAGRSLRQRVSLVPYVLVVYTACAAALLVAVLAGGDPTLGYPLREWALFLGMAVGPGILGHTVVNWALEHVESAVVSVTLLGEPVGSTVLALVLLGEAPGSWTVAGGAVVLAGIFHTARERQRASPGPDSAASTD